MADPNLTRITEFTPKNKSGVLTTTLTTQLLDGVSNKTLRIHLFTIANVDASNNADATITIHDGSNARAIVPAITVPSKATLIVIGCGERLNLDENSEVRGGASAANDLEYFISYDELDDA